MKREWIGELWNRCHLREIPSNQASYQIKENTTLEENKEKEKQKKEETSKEKKENPLTMCLSLSLNFSHCLSCNGISAALGMQQSWHIAPLSVALATQ